MIYLMTIYTTNLFITEGVKKSTFLLFANVCEKVGVFYRMSEKGGARFPDMPQKLDVFKRLPLSPNIDRCKNISMRL